MDRREFAQVLGGIAANACLPGGGSSAPNPRGKKHRIMFYEDSTQMLMLGDGRMKRDHVERWVQTLVGTQVDSISWTMALPDVCLYDTRIGDRLGKGDSVRESWVWGIVSNLESLISAGDDPLKVVCETAHRA